MSETLGNVQQVKLSDIDLEDKTFQTRISFDEDYIRRLADDIEVNGQRNPIGLERKNGGYRVVYGFCRIEAIQLLSRETINARIYDSLTLRQAHIHNLSDNILHEDLSTLEFALKLKFMRESFHFPIEELARISGSSSGTVYNLIRLTTLEQEIQFAVHEDKITLSHALEIAKFPEFKRLKILKQVIRDKLSAVQIKRLKGLSGNMRKVTLNVPTTIAEILKDLPVESQTKIMERIMNFGTRPHNPEWYTNFGKGTLLDAVKWNKKDYSYSAWYKFFVEPLGIPKYGCEYSTTVAAIKARYKCPNEVEYVVLSPESGPDVPLEQRVAWFFWCKECIEEQFPNTRFYPNVMWRIEEEL